MKAKQAKAILTFPTKRIEARKLIVNVPCFISEVDGEWQYVDDAEAFYLRNLPDQDLANDLKNEGYRGNSVFILPVGIETEYFTFFHRSEDILIAKYQDILKSINKTFDGYFD